MYTYIYIYIYIYMYVSFVTQIIQNSPDEEGLNTLT